MLNGFHTLDSKVYHFKNDKIHRDDGPAVIYDNGSEMWYKDDQLHRENGPAIIHPSLNHEAYYLNGIRYSGKNSYEEALKKLKVKSDYLQGDSLSDTEMHDIIYDILSDGPADKISNKDNYYKDGYCKVVSGNEFWYDYNGKLHRIEGPAIVERNGSMHWYRHGVQHRKDGPASIIVGKNITLCKWYLNGKMYTESEFNERIGITNNTSEPKQSKKNSKADPPKVEETKEEPNKSHSHYLNEYIRSNLTLIITAIILAFVFILLVAALVMMYSGFVYWAITQGA